MLDARAHDHGGGKHPPGARHSRRPVWDLKSAYGSAQAGLREVLAPVSHAVIGSLAMAAQPAKFSGAAGDSPVREPRLGEHTGIVLGELLGLGAAEIEALRETGVL